jgi:hypothetical protein
MVLSPQLIFDKLFVLCYGTHSFHLVYYVLNLSFQQQCKQVNQPVFIIFNTIYQNLKESEEYFLEATSSQHSIIQRNTINNGDHQAVKT